MDPQQRDQSNSSASSYPQTPTDAGSQWRAPRPSQPPAQDNAQFYQFEPPAQTQQTSPAQVVSAQPQYPVNDPTYQAYVQQYYEQWQRSDPVGYQAYVDAYHQNYVTNAVPPQPTGAVLEHQSIEPQVAALGQAPAPVGTYQLPTKTEAHLNSYSPEQTTSTTPTSPPAVATADTNKKIPGRLKPFIMAALAGILIFGVFNSQIIVGQLKYLISPDTNASEAGIGDTEVVGSESSVVIPKINVNAPVVYDETSFDEGRIQKALERGVVHYGNTAVPGQIGNSVIVGHSSNNWWSSGKYKFAFVLLDKLEVGDTFNLHYQGKRYVYQIIEKKVIDPKDLSILSQPTDQSLATLLTCTPAGTSLHRLIVTGKQISPDPAQDKPAPAASVEASELLPGNTPSLWEQIKRRFFTGSGS